jgi:hypothetical protein
MKKIVLAVATTFIAGTVLTNCTSPEQKLENAQKNVIEADQDLDKANKEYLNDIENYRKLTAEKIEANERSLVEFKQRIEKQKKEAKANYQKRIDELDHENSDMKKKLDDYKAEGKDNWEKFKEEFNRDMDELNNSIKNFWVVTTNKTKLL